MSDSQGAAAAVIEQLAAQGVSHIVISPGSRSAPLALAAWQADRDGLVHTYVRVDERGAGFLALGLAKSSGWPAAVVTTSGTAAGNLLPAIMEASHSQIPLIAITADRPASWAGFGASQTTDQAKIFGGFARWQTHISAAGDPHSWAAQAARAVLTSRGVLGERPGPVHLNVHLSEPLAHRSDILLHRATPVLRRQSKHVEPVAFKPVRETVVICGDADPLVGAEAAGLAAATGYPLIAEPSSNARFGAALSCGRLVLASRLAGEVKRVVVYGHPTLSREV
ncbi:MAG: 2-succinyl-5-enolpyruvyl-6-hydroxy-3-cyclohexene-1-carboxylic-acid synthase, partial [Propionibacteriaceae bacterium]|nr:2-succinyl-5-enolpyruvyl-6-hydroxy-3-cyclohexene-1-carboxylic-acid synthase [Propionibacteriaceae bacterium]